VSKASDGLDLLQESAGRHFHSHVVKVQHRKLEERLSMEWKPPSITPPRDSTSLSMHDTRGNGSTVYRVQFTLPSGCSAR
jgi:hypothetical protein